jgi:hypothetical protein
MITTVPAQARNLGRRRIRIAVVVVSAIVAVAGSILLALGGRGERATTHGVTATLHTPGLPEFAVADNSSLWISSRGANTPANGFSSGRLVRINLATGTAERTVQLRGQTANLVRYGNRLIADPTVAGAYKDVYTAPGELVAVDWRSGRLLARRHQQPANGPIAVGGGRLWAVVERPASILELNPNTFAPVASPLSLGASRVFGLTWGNGYLWASASDAGDVLRINPTTRAITRVHVGGFPIGIVLAGGSLWVINNLSASVLRLNPATLQTIGQPIHTPSGGAFYLGATDGYVFVANVADGTITRIDQRTGTIAGQPIRIAPPTPNASTAAAYGVAPAGSAIWATSPSTATVSRIEAKP